MKLKYYLRGIGIGVFITTMIFMISISIHKNDFNQENIRQQETDAKTVAQAETETAQASQDAAGNTETKAAGAANTDTEAANKNKTGTGTDAAETDKAGTGTDAAKTDKAGTGTDTAKKTGASEAGAAEKKGQSSGKTEEKVRFEIGGGEYSDVTCRRLQEAGIIDDAETFNKYLIQKDYDNLILPGVYDIPKGADYDEIAALLTTKVEEETAQ